MVTSVGLKGFLGKPTIAERVQTFRMEKQPHHGDFTLLFFCRVAAAGRVCPDRRHSRGTYLALSRLKQEQVLLLLSILLYSSSCLLLLFTEFSFYFLSEHLQIEVVFPSLTHHTHMHTHSDTHPLHTHMAFRVGGVVPEVVM